MITYEYKARNLQTNEIVKSEVQAESTSAAAKLLMDQDLAPVEIHKKGEGSNPLSFLTNRISNDDIVLFTRQLSTLINAGLPLTQSLRSVREQINSQGLYKVINQVISDVEGGTTLSEAFGKHPKVFDSIFVNLIAAGETSGSLDEALKRIATQREKEAAVTSKIRSALVYPFIVLFVIGAVLIFMLTTVLPQIKQLYADMDQELPFLTNILISFSDFIINFWWLILVGVAGLGYGIYNYTRSGQGRKWLDKVKMRMPIFGKIFMKVYMARFARTSSVLLASGVPMLEMIRISKGAVNNVHIAQSLDRAAKEVKGGTALSDALEGDDNFLPLVPQMISIGEQSGTIDQMMQKIADYFEEQVDSAVGNLSTTIEPILMIVLGLTVGFIVAAILLPVYGLISATNIQ